MKVLLYAAGAVAFLYMMSWVGNMEAEDRQTARQHYCEMVDIHYETNGEYGWPPYKGECE